MIWAWIGAVIIGLSLGLLGSGGSILTVPTLVYLVGQDEKVAIAGSLAIVGSISLIGSIPYALKRQIDWSSVLLFGVPGMAGTYLGAFLSRYVSGTTQLAIFSVVMLLAAVLMLRPVRAGIDLPRARRAVWKISFEGLSVGVMTGFVGVGGGFLIVPALVLLGGMPMRLAVGTSLLIIAMKSGSGFYKYIDVLAAQGLRLDWRILATVTGLGIAGSFVGSYFSTRLPQVLLRKIFAVLLIVMAVYILWRELILTR